MQDMKHNISQLQDLCCKDILTIEDTATVSKILRNYFDLHGRNQSFVITKDALAKRFKELLAPCGMIQGVEFAEQFYLFNYTLSQDYERSQKEIYEAIAKPFKDWVLQKWDHMRPGFEFSTRNGSNTIMIVARHCTTVGKYAPGKSIYSWAEALLVEGYHVDIICLGDLEDKFSDLEKKYKNLRISKLIVPGLKIEIVSILEIIRLNRPRCILSEMEFGIGALLGILSKNIPTYYLCQGFYNLPWFEKIVLSNIHKENNLSERKKDLIFMHPFISRTLLAPEPNHAAISDAKRKLQISDTDIVLSALGRMEKFSPEFLDDCVALLGANSRIKLILAGPNDQSVCREKLARYIDEFRVFVLPLSDAHTLGYLSDFGIDSYPNPAGLSALEFMAKGKPFFTKQRQELSMWSKQRQPEFVYEDHIHLNLLITQLTSNKKSMQKARDGALELVNIYGLKRAKETLNALCL